MSVIQIFLEKERPIENTLNLINIGYDVAGKPSWMGFPSRFQPLG